MDYKFLQEIGKKGDKKESNSEENGRVKQG